MIDKEKRQNEILDACFAVFTEKGLERSTMRDFADAVKLPLGSLYQSFSNKDEIIVSCVERQYLLTEEEIIDRLDAQSTTLGDILEQTLLQCEKRVDRIRFTWQVQASPKYGPQCREAMKRVHKRYLDYAQKICDVAMLPEKDFFPLYLAFNGLIDYYAVTGDKSYIDIQLNYLIEKMKTLEAAT